MRVLRAIRDWLRALCRLLEAVFSPEPTKPRLPDWADPTRYRDPEAYAIGLMDNACPTTVALQLLANARRRFEREQMMARAEDLAQRTAASRDAQKDSHSAAGRSLCRQLGIPLDEDPEPALAIQIWHSDGQPYALSPRELNMLRYGPWGNG